MRVPPSSSSAPVDSYGLMLKPRGMFLGTHLDDLLSRPLSCRVGRYVEVDNFPVVVTQHDKGEEHSKCDREDGEDVDGDDVGQVVIR